MNEILDLAARILIAPLTLLVTLTTWIFKRELARNDANYERLQNQLAQVNSRLDEILLAIASDRSRK